MSIWDLACSSNLNKQPLYVFNSHKAAVKAIDWCPWQNNLLATGGGINDCSIKIWNTYNGLQVKSVTCSSQVTGAIWSDKNFELLSSHGDGNLSIWNYPNLNEVGTLKGHDERILSIVISPVNREIVASLSADQTLRVWECFKADDAKENSRLIESSSISNGTLTRLNNIR